MYKIDVILELMFILIRLYIQSIINLVDRLTQIT